MGPGTPAVPTIWRYRDMRPQLLRAIDLITAKEAERRVFMLENPGLPGTGYITTSLYCGLQVIKPGEIAPAHRHSPNALRFIIEGEGAYTTVEGERVVMRPGDFVLTPGWTWHDHGHLGQEPVIWLDALDNPFGQFFGAIFRENYPDDAQAPSLADGDAAARYGSGLMPLTYNTGRTSSPLLVYPYDRTREALLRLARSGALHPSHGVKMRYANPLDGGYVYPTIAVFIQYLPKGFSGQTYRSTDAALPISATRRSTSSRTTCSWCRPGRPITSPRPRIACCSRSPIARRRKSSASGARRIRPIRPDDRRLA
jgi:gentisate 1,2-dioxygenase